MRFAARLADEYILINISPVNYSSSDRINPTKRIYLSTVEFVSAYVPDEGSWNTSPAASR